MASSAAADSRPLFRPQFAPAPPQFSASSRGRLFDSGATGPAGPFTPTKRTITTTGTTNISTPAQTTTPSPAPSSPASSTYSASTAASSPTSSVSSLGSPTAGCPKCGHGGGGGVFARPVADDEEKALAAARARIDELQAQVCALNEKAMEAVEKWAGYEDELARLKRELKQSRTASITSSSSSTSSPQRGSFPVPPEPVSTGILSSFWAAKPAPPPPPSPPPLQVAAARIDATTDSLLVALSKEQQKRVTGDQTLDDLLVALTREQQLRAAAEAREEDASREVEELSATLFEQANEMVASERRARALLEERVGVLEQRDLEKRRRLERLELAVGRIERVKRLLEES